MTETTLKTLRQLLAERYDEFLARLTRRLGSDEAARETLHETWLHLHGKNDPGALQNRPGICCGPRSIWRPIANAKKSSGPAGLKLARCSMSPTMPRGPIATLKRGSKLHFLNKCSKN